MQRDPKGRSIGFGLQAYAECAPVTLSDPLGLDPPKPIRIKYKQSTKSDPAEAAAENKEAAQKKVEKHNREHPDEQVPPHLGTAAIGRPIDSDGDGKADGYSIAHTLSSDRIRCRTKFKGYESKFEFYWNKPPVILEPDDGSRSEHEDGHVATTQGVIDELNENEEKEGWKVREDPNEERDRKTADARKEAKKRNAAYDKKTHYGRG